MKKLLRLSVAVTSLSLLCSTAWAEGNDEPSTDDGSGMLGVRGGRTADKTTDEEDAYPLSASISMGAAFGAASILSDSQYTQTDYFMLTTGLGASYKTPVDKLNLSANIGYNKFLTDGGGMIEKREGRVGDLGIMASYGSIFKDEEVTGINLSGSFGFRFPTSTASRFQGLRTKLSPGLNLSRDFGGLTLSYGLGAGVYFHEYTSPVADVDEVDIIVRDTGAENVSEGLAALGSVLPQYSLSNSFSMSFGFLDGFSANMYLAYSDVWTYDNGSISVDDEFTAPDAVPGRGHKQAVSGGGGVGYQINDYMAANAGVSTDGLPKTSDNRSFRFPFWDFENGQAARTSFSLGVSGQF